MKLSPSAFDRLRQENRLVLSLIGMSNIGKTYWSEHLDAIGFAHIDCDALIEEKLAPLLRQHGYEGIQDVSRWMGQPYDQRYAVHQHRYLSCECDVMQDVCASLRDHVSQNTVIATTGSVVHTSAELCACLREYSLVVYIEASVELQEEMFQRYIAQPKPVVFGDVFSQHDDEAPAQALERSYRALLQKRSALYAATADVTIPRAALTAETTVEEFLSCIQHAL